MPSTTPLLLFLLALLFLCVVGAKGSLNGTVRLCHIVNAVPWPGLEHIGFAAQSHMEFAATDYFGPKMDPLLSFKYIPISYQNRSDLKAVVQATINDVNNENCHVVVGPTTSGYSLAISPLINMPWISDTATSTELTDKNVHFWFSRVCPTDEATGGALAFIMKTFGWGASHAICSDESYGRSLLQGFTTGLNYIGGRLEQTHCGINTKESAIPALESIRRSGLASQGSRLIQVSSVDSTGIMEAALELGMHKTHIFLFADVECNNADKTNLLFNFTGAMCVTYDLSNDAAIQNYQATWQQQPRGRFTYAIGNESYVIGPDYPFSGYAALSVDTVRSAMQAVTDMFHSVKRDLDQFDPTDSATLREFLRKSRVPDGFTGPIAYDRNLDRVGAAVGFYTVEPGGVLRRYASFNNLTGVTFGDNVTSAKDLAPFYWLGSDTPVETIPEGSAPVSKATQYKVPSILVIVVFAGSLVLIVILFLIYQLRNLTQDVMTKLFRSNLLVVFWKLIGQLVDSTTDIMSCIEVVTRGGDQEVLVIFYLTMTAVALTAGVVDSSHMIRYIYQLVQSKATLDDDHKDAFEGTHTRISLLTLVIEDIPMAILAAAALNFEFDWFILISMVISCGFAGAKIRSMPQALKGLRNTSVEGLVMDEELGDNGAPLTELTKAPSMSIFSNPMAGMEFMDAEKRSGSMGSTASAEPQPHLSTQLSHGPSGSVEALINFAAVAPLDAHSQGKKEQFGSLAMSFNPAKARDKEMEIAKRFPQRHRALLDAADEMLEVIRRYKIGNTEFSAVVSSDLNRYFDSRLRMHQRREKESSESPSGSAATREHVQNKRIALEE